METWLENNNRYLEASLAWLRLRLERVVSELRQSEVKEAANSRQVASQVDPPPALVILAHRFGLSEFERDTLLLCAASEFDPSLAAMYGAAQSFPGRTYPTFALAFALLEDASWDALAAHRPLRYYRLIEINQPGSTPLTASALRADERIVNFLKGLNVIDDRLITLFERVPAADSSLLSVSQQCIAQAILHRIRRADDDGTPVQLLGVDSGSRLAVAQKVCTDIGRRLFRLQVESLPANVSEVETLARLWQREAALLSVALYIETDEGLAPETTSALQKFLSGQHGLVFVGVREAPVQLRRASFTVEVRKPTRLEQRDAWANILNTLEPENGLEDAAQILAGQFNLNLNDIRNVSVVALEDDSEKSVREKLWDGCRDLTETNLDSLAERLEPKATWNDLVLPAEQSALLRQIVGQVRERHRVYDQWGFSGKMNRGFGISALFAGESGTGKTMAAEVIANDLQLNLYRIDLSAVVNKYIGETEKNLRKVFDAAERGGAILFFDEADALFGKRSEVKDSHDRYANIEINYLLQRMEAFSGLAILATNMKSALDPAFMRRLRFIVNLPFPGVNERRLIWQKALPPQTPTKDLNYERLARLNISGGNIHSIALSAAFMAALNGQTVTMPILLAAARVELRKLDKLFGEAEFRQ